MDLRKQKPPTLLTGPLAPELATSVIGMVQRQLFTLCLDGSNNQEDTIIIVLLLVPIMHLLMLGYVTLLINPLGPISILLKKEKINVSTKY